jgi:hypothetical protein
MGRLDKDRYQKELAIRYCLLSGLFPYLEVTISSETEVSDTIEQLTDIDVLGISALGDGRLHRTIFDCKSSARMSAINRAFWTSGLSSYVGAEAAFVILGGRAPRNHRLAALKIDVDLHDEDSFIALGRSLDPLFPHVEAYQASIDRWQTLEDAYVANTWAQGLRDQIAFNAPLAQDPKATFRKTVSSLRATRGYFDPRKPSHLAIMFDVLASTFVSLIVITRDLRRIFDPKMDKQEFEGALRYYIWGGRESYLLRKQLSSKSNVREDDNIDLPAWNELVRVLGVILDSPKSMYDCAFLCKEVALRCVSGRDLTIDAILDDRFKDEGRAVQYAAALGSYMTKAGNLPTDMQGEIDAALYGA